MDVFFVALKLFLGSVCEHLSVLASAESWCTKLRPSHLSHANARRHQV